MQQELHFSLSRKSQRTAARHIFKIALKTIPRCGFAALVLMCLGFYFLFPACQTFQQIQTEKNTPYELYATTDSDSVDLNTLIQIDGVERISPILKLNATLSLDDFILACEVKAVQSSFLRLKFAEGTMYPDSSNMPYLIFNEAASKSFSNEDQTTEVSLQDTVLVSANGINRKAVVCGIFDDGSKVPTIYMSYDAARKQYGHNGQTELIILLKVKGAASQVVSELQRHNIYANFDSSITLALEVMLNQCWQTAFLSVAFLSSSVVLICEKRQSEIRSCRSENAVLIISGITEDMVAKIYPSRIVLTGFLCSAAAALIAVVTGTFSVAAVGINVICVGIFAVFGVTQR